MAFGSIDFNSPATLQGVPPSQAGDKPGGKIAEGTLAEMVKRAMTLIASDYKGVMVLFDPGALPGSSSGIIREDEIRQLFKRDDFPH